jgi:hypothetical protein
MRFFKDVSHPFLCCGKVLMSYLKRGLIVSVAVSALMLFAGSGLTIGSFSLAPSARAAGSAHQAFVMSVKLTSPNQKQSDGTSTDTVKILVTNPGQGETLRFKFWRQDKDFPVAPVVLRSDGGAKPYDSKNRKWSKWRLYLPKNSARMLTFTVRSTGADNYCTQDKFGTVCSDGPESLAATAE